MFSFVFSGANRELLFPNKKPAIDWQSRVFGNLCYRLENSTHDAKQTGAAVPNGHASLDLLRALLRCKRVCHFLTPTEDTIFGELSKRIRLKSYSECIRTLYKLDETGDWKVARTRRLESLRYARLPAAAVE